jgi:4-amino-4-deoxychorismate lyase
MSRFIETILAENGIVSPLEYHQERVDRTLRDWDATLRLDLREALESVAVPPFEKSKIRVEYGVGGLECIQVSEYRIKNIQSIGLAAIGDREYRYKYADREWIYSLVGDSGCDEVVMVKDGFVSDASIANLAFYDGRQWITPDTPLLSGTRRRYLLDAGVLHEAPVRIEDIRRFTKIRLVNAMIPWDESPDLPIGIVMG